MAIALLLIYIFVGIAVYALSDTSTVASRLSDALFVVPYGVIREHVFLFVVALWPIWLFVKAKTAR